MDTKEAPTPKPNFQFISGSRGVHILSQGDTVTNAYINTTEDRLTTSIITSDGTEIVIDAVEHPWPQTSRNLKKSSAESCMRVIASYLMEGRNVELNEGKPR